MRVAVLNGKRLPIKGSTTDSCEADRIREERQLAEYLRQFFKSQQQIIESTDVLANNADRQENYLLKELVAEMEVKRSMSSTSINPALDNGSVEALNTSGYEMGFGSRTDLAGPSTESQKWLDEGELQTQANSAFEGAVSIETETVSPLSVSGQLISHGLDSMEAHLSQCIQENIIERPDNEMTVDDEEQNRESIIRVHRLRSRTSPVNRSKVSLRKRKQLRYNSNKSNLFAKRAPNVHKRARPFKCLICSAAFNQRIHLSTHLLIHTNERPLMCDICERSFRQKTTLTNHMRIHSGEKPYACNVCKKTFRQISNLLAHRKVHAEAEA